MFNFRMQQQDHDGIVRENKLLLRWLRTLSDEDIKSYKSKTRLLAAQYLDMNYVRRATQARSPEAYRAIAEGRKGDLEIAWSLLQCQPEDESESVAVRLLALKLATRLKDKSRMLPLFEAIMVRISSEERAVTQEALSAFMSAPVLGRWEDTRVLGQHCISNGILLNDLHKLAQDAPDIPDLQILYEFAQMKIPRMTEQNIEERSVRWIEYIIKAVRIKVRTKQDAKNDGIENASVNSRVGPWKVIDIPSETKILRFGAIAQMLSFSMNPIPMVGPATDTKILVKGYVTTPNGRRSEQICVKNKGSDRWRGEYICMEEEQTILRVDIEMTLEEVNGVEAVDIKRNLGRTSGKIRDGNHF